MLNDVVDHVSWSRRAKGDGTSAGASAGGVIRRVTIRGGTCALEHLRVRRRRARRRRRVVARAAILRRVEFRAGALARHHAGARPLPHHLQLRRAVAVEVGMAARVLTVAGTGGSRQDYDADFVAVDDADVV